jgi:hypothetical protein
MHIRLIEFITTSDWYACGECAVKMHVLDLIPEPPAHATPAVSQGGPSEKYEINSMPVICHQDTHTSQQG